MKNKVKVSFKSPDITFVVINLLTYRIFTQLPMTLIKASRSAAPLSAIFSGVLSIGIIYLLSVCFSKHTDGNLLDTASTLFGKCGKIIFSLLVVVYLAVSLIFALEDFSNLIRLIAFPSSPLWFITVFLILGTVLGALGGLRPIMRLHGIFVPIIIIVLILLIVSTIYPSDISRLFPLLGTGTESVFGNALSGIVLYTDIILLFLIAPTQESRLYMAKKVNIGVFFAFLLNFLFILAFTLKIPSTIAQNQQFPVYLLMKEVYFGRFFQRLDALLLLTSALSSMLYMSLNLNLTGAVLRQGFNLSLKPPVTILLGILAVFAVLTKDILPSYTIWYLVYICGFGVLAFSILAAIFAKVRCVLNEKK